MKARLIILAAVACLLVVAASALGAGAVGGATYEGRLKPGHGVPLSDGVPIALKVSASGAKVTPALEAFPLFCEGGGPPQVIRFDAAKIEGGKFKSTGTEKFHGALTATAVVTGKFIAGHKVKGTFEDKFTKIPACNGKTTFTAKVAPAQAPREAHASRLRTEVTYRFSSGDAKAKVGRGIFGLGFFTATENGKTVEVYPEEWEGAEDGSLGRAAIALTLEPTCENKAADVTTSARVNLFIRRGHFGYKPLPVHGNHFTYKGPAFDGHASAGKIQVTAKFTKQGTIATGTVLLKNGKATGLGGESLTACHTGSGPKPKPLPFRLVGEI
jgi:hypothetical protein